MISPKFKVWILVFNQVSNMFLLESNDFYGDNISPREVNDTIDQQDRSEFDDGKSGYADKSSEAFKKVKEDLSPSMINNDMEDGSKRKESLESAQEKESKKHHKVNEVNFYRKFSKKL